MEPIHLQRIVVTSPGDMQLVCDTLPTVILEKGG
jgi:hypothetical protein